MATIRKHRANDGSLTYTATVRIKPYPSASKTFAKRSDAQAWGQELGRELRKQREAGGVRRDVTRMNIAQLVIEYLDDPETKVLRYFDALSLLLAWWTGRYAATKVME